MFTSYQPSMRYIEPLVYQSHAYSEDRQSVQLSIETGVAPVYHEHPRLPTPEVLELRIRSGTRAGGAL
jgi:hypothetical protein